MTPPLFGLRAVMSHSNYHNVENYSKYTVNCKKKVAHRIGSARHGRKSDVDVQTIDSYATCVSRGPETFSR